MVLQPREHNQLLNFKMFYLFIELFNRSVLKTTQRFDRLKFLPFSSVKLA